MSHVRDMLEEITRRLTAGSFEGQGAVDGLFSAMDGAALLHPFSDTAGEVAWPDVEAVIRTLGETAPLTAFADAIAADYIAEKHGLKAGGPLSLTGEILALSEHGKVSGTLTNIALPPGDARLLAVARTPKSIKKVVLLAAEGVARPDNRGISGELRTDLTFEAAEPLGMSADLPDDETDCCLLTGALVRSLLISGAISKVLTLTIEHCVTRKQFGRPLSAFQAIQQHLATLAAENAAARAISQLAAERFNSPYGCLVVAAAKVRTAKAARLAIDLSHQCHGAIGFTEEYALHRFTRHLVAWRAEFGHERHWATVAGRAVSNADAQEGLWPLTVAVAGERASA